MAVILEYQYECYQVALVVKDPPANAEDLKTLGFDPRRRAWQPTPVFLPREAHGLQSLGSQSDTTKATQHASTHA